MAPGGSKKKVPERLEAGRPTRGLGGPEGPRRLWEGFRGLGFRVRNPQQLTRDPWLWEGRRMCWVGPCHRNKKAYAPPHRRRWTALSLGFLRVVP